MKTGSKEIICMRAGEDLLTVVLCKQGDEITYVVRETLHAGLVTAGRRESRWEIISRIEQEICGKLGRRHHGHPA
jgi:uncharacterized protein Yka (UPF0111/DUF47 family)